MLPNMKSPTQPLGGICNLYYMFIHSLITLKTKSWNDHHLHNFGLLKKQIHLQKKTKHMKAIILKISFIFLFLSLMGAGCEKDENNDNNLVVKEFPTLSMGYNLKPGETVIIRNQDTFEKIFSKDLIAQITSLQNIDFTKYDVLAGENFYTRGIAKLEHKFIKMGNYSYLYKLDIFHNLTLPAGSFCYGIIINKLPTEAIVKFEVTKINE